jgi:Membrane-associated phospholipid phosphatase
MINMINMVQLLDAIQSVDANVIYWIYQTGGNSLFDFIAVLFSYVGTYRLIALLLCFFFWTKKETRQITFVLFVSIIVSGLLVGLIKEIADRPRPYIMLGLTAADMLVHTNPYVSFVSGHATSAFVTAAAVSYYFRKWLIPAVFIACVAGLSRIYLLVHYPSDVIAGAIFGVFVFFVILLLFKSLDRLGGSNSENISG